MHLGFEIDFLAIYYVSCTYSRQFVETLQKDCVVRPFRPGHDSSPNLTPQILKFAPNEVKECRNRSENLINRKRTNFCIEATPPKNSQRKKNSRKKSIRKKYFWKIQFLKKSPEILQFLKNWEFVRFWKLIFKYIGNKKNYHFLKKIITFSKIWNVQGFPIFLKKISNFFKNHAKKFKNFQKFWNF